MICEGKRQNDEIYCLRCDLRWSAGEAAPPSALCREEPVQFKSNQTRLTRLACIALACLRKPLDHQQRGAALAALEFAANPDMKMEFVDDRIDHALKLIPSLEGLRET